MTDTPFSNHRTAALGLLQTCLDLSHKEAGFLGHVCVAVELSRAQLDWLIKLLQRKGLPPLAQGGGQ